MKNTPDMEKAASRKEALLQEKSDLSNSGKKSTIKVVSPDGKMDKKSILGLSVVAVLLSLSVGFFIYSSFFAQPEQGIVLAGPLTLEEELRDSGGIVPGENLNKPGSGAFGLPADVNNPNAVEEGQFTIEDYANNVNYNIIGNIIATASPSAERRAIYRAVGTEQPASELLNVVARALNVQGEIKGQPGQEAFGVFQGTTLDATKQNITYSRISNEGDSLASPLRYWFYDEGYTECNLNIDYDITNYTQSQLNSLTQEDRNCYYSKSAFGLAKPFPANENLVSSKSDRFMENLGNRLSDYKKTVRNSDGLTIINYSYLLEGEPTTLEFEFVYSDVDKLRSAYGAVFNIQKIGDFDMESPADVTPRLNNILYYATAPTEYISTYPGSFPYRPISPEVGSYSIFYITPLNVQYVEGINPGTNPIPPGISTNFLNIPNPKWVKQVDSSTNTWLISLGVEVPEKEAAVLPEQVDNSPEILSVALDIESAKQEIVDNITPKDIDVNNYVEVWGEVLDFKGNLIIARSYLFVNDEEKIRVGAILAYSDSAIGIR